MDEYRSLRCSSDDDTDHAICRASYVGVPVDEIFCGCRCHVIQIERRFGL